MLIYDPSGTDNRKTKDQGWVPGRSIQRPTRRRWDSPRNYRTAAKSAQRARFAVIASMWALVTPSGIIAWQDAIAGYQSEAPAGVKMPATAFTLFMYVNLNRMGLGSAIVFMPPTPVAVEVLQCSDFALQSSPRLMVFQVDNQSYPSGWITKVAISLNASPGTRATPQEVSLVSNVQPLVQGNHFISWLDLDQFGNNVPGQIRNVLVVGIHNVTGQMTNTVLASTNPYPG